MVVVANLWAAAVLRLFRPLPLPLVSVETGISIVIFDPHLEMVTPDGRHGNVRVGDRSDSMVVHSRSAGGKKPAKTRALERMLLYDRAFEAMSILGRGTCWAQAKFEY